MSTKPPVPKKVLCHECGRRCDSAATTCVRCGAALLLLCECGAEARLYERTCTGCGEPLVKPEYPLATRLRRILVVAVLVGLVLAAVGAAVNARLRYRTSDEPWRLRDQAYDAIQEGRHAEAHRMLIALCERQPRDARAWHMRAVTEQALGFDRQTVRRSVRIALEIDPSHSLAAAFLAADLTRTNEWREALDLARVAAAVPHPSEDVLVLLGRLELQQPYPDLERAAAALDSAVAKGCEDAEVFVQLALLHLRRLRFAPPDAFPPEAFEVLRRAERAIEGLPPARRANRLFRVAGAEFALARGDALAARSLVESLLAEPAHLEPRTLADLHVLHGRVLFAQREPDAGLAAFDRALEMGGDPSAAAQVSEFLLRLGRTEQSVRIVEAALPAATDPAAAGMRSVLAVVALHRGDIDAAARLVSEARVTLPDDARLMLLEGDVHLTAGRVEEAVAAYDAAAQVAPGVAEPLVHRALAALVTPGSQSDREAAIREQIGVLEQLAEEHDEDSGRLLALGRLHTAVGEADRALPLLDRARRRDGSRAEIWLAIAAAHAVSTDPEALRDAGEAALRAARLEPYDPRIALPAAEIALRLGAAQEANVTCGKFLETHPGHVAATLLQAQALRYQRRPHEAAMAIERLPDVAQLGAAGFEVLVDSWLRAGSPVRAREAALRARARNLDSARLDFLLVSRGAADEHTVRRLEAAGPSRSLAAHRLREGDHAGAIAILRELSSETPFDAAVARLLVLALLDSAENANDDDVAEARKLISSLPEGAPAGLREFLRGRVRLLDGDLEGALEDLKRAAAAQPYDAYAHFFLGQALYESERRVEALPELRRAVALPGAIPAFAVHLSRCLFEVSETTGSRATREALLWEARALSPLNVDATLGLFNALVERAAFGDAARLAAGLLAHVELPPDLERRVRRAALKAGLEHFEYGLAIEQLDRLEVLGGNGRADRLFRALLLLAESRPDEAVPTLEALVAEDPADMGPLLALLECHARAGRPGRAREILRARRESRGAETAVAFELTRILIRTRSYREAAEEAEELVAAQPQDAAAWRLAIAVEHTRGRLDAALALARRAEESVAKEDRVGLALLRGDTLRAAGRAEESLRVAREVAKRPGADARAREEARLLEAESALLLDRVAVARELIAGLDAAWEAQEADPPLARGVAARYHFAHGVLAQLDGRADEALTRFEHALRLNPRDHSAANNLAWELARVPGRGGRALQLAVAATEVAPEVAAYWDTRAVAARAADLPDDAESSWRRALELLEAREPVPVEEWSRYAARLSELLRDLGRNTEARELAESVIERSPGGAAAQRARELLALPNR